MNILEISIEERKKLSIEIMEQIILGASKAEIRKRYGLNISQMEKIYSLGKNSLRDKIPANDIDKFGEMDLYYLKPYRENAEYFLLLCKTALKELDIKNTSATIEEILSNADMVISMQYRGRMSYLKVEASSNELTNISGKIYGDENLKRNFYKTIVAESMEELMVMFYSWVKTYLS